MIWIDMDQCYAETMLFQEELLALRTAQATMEAQSQARERPLDRRDLQEKLVCREVFNYLPH